MGNAECNIEEAVKRADLLRALEHDELRVHYQPKVDIETRVPVGVEALARWEHPRRGFLGPAEFPEHAERDPELLAGVTRATLDRAVHDCATWYRDGPDLPVAVNIAAPMLLGGLLVAAVNAALRRHDLSPHLLTLETTESAITLQGPEAAGVLGELRAIGVRVSLDDFGTGYSSLARLRTFPLDELKVDPSFVRARVLDRSDRREPRDPARDRAQPRARRPRPGCRVSVPGSMPLSAPAQADLAISLTGALVR